MDGATLIMPLDASIYSNMLRPVKSVAEYTAENQAQQQNLLGLQAARQNLLMGQQKMDAYTREQNMAAA